MVNHQPTKCDVPWSSALLDTPGASGVARGQAVAAADSWGELPLVVFFFLMVHDGHLY